MPVKAEIEPALKAWQTQNRSPKADVSYITSSAVFIEAHFSFHSNTGRTVNSQWQTAMWSAAATAAADDDGNVFFSITSVRTMQRELKLWSVFAGQATVPS